MAALLIALTVLLSLLLCGIYRRLAGRWQLLDIPNARSAHQLPVPRGGGIGLYLGLLAGFFLLGLLRGWPAQFNWLVILGAVLAVAGVVDDRRGLPVLLRLAVYALVCASASWLLLGHVSPWLLLPAAVAALWLLNLFNFMDGIDGLAASEAIFAAAVAAGLSQVFFGATDYAVFCLLLAAACVGFLYWNWAPARLFMGDAGSVALGFLLAGLSMLGYASQALPASCWLILLAVFITDASLTLGRRAFNGERITQAHSQHAYQRLARHWGSHARVVGWVQAYNLCWLLPLAIASLLWPQLLAVALVAAYLPLLLGWRKAVILP